MDNYCTVDILPIVYTHALYCLVQFHCRVYIYKSVELALLPHLYNNNHHHHHHRTTATAAAAMTLRGIAKKVHCRQPRALSITDERSLKRVSAGYIFAVAFESECAGIYRSDRERDCTGYPYAGTSLRGNKINENHYCLYIGRSLSR